MILTSEKEETESITECCRRGSMRLAPLCNTIAAGTYIAQIIPGIKPGFVSVAPSNSDRVIPDGRNRSQSIASRFIRLRRRMECVQEHRLSFALGAWTLIAQVAKRKRTDMSVIPCHRYRVSACLFNRCNSHSIYDTIAVIICFKYSPHFSYASKFKCNPSSLNSPASSPRSFAKRG